MIKLCMRCDREKRGQNSFLKYPHLARNVVLNFSMRMQGL